MPSSAEQIHLSPDGYLAWEAQQPTRHEYLAGEVFAMTGTSLDHNRLALGLAARLLAHLQGSPCQVFMADVKVQIEAADAFFYPDLAVTCAPEDLRERQLIRAPVLIVEVLSPSTAGYDAGAKFAAYRTLPSLREYVLIDSERPRVDVFRRDASDHWVLWPYAAGDTVELPSLAFNVALDALYASVRFGGDG